MTSQGERMANVGSCPRTNNELKFSSQLEEHSNPLKKANMQTLSQCLNERKCGIVITKSIDVNSKMIYLVTSSLRC